MATILVLYGGKSAEHDVSVHSAETVGRLVKKLGYNTLSVYITKKGEWLLQKRCGCVDKSGRRLMPLLYGKARLQAIVGGRHFGFDAVFPVLHGPMGEDGTMQGLLELMGCPYVGCGVLASSLGMDKELCKKVAALEGVPVLSHFVLDKTERSGWQSAHAKALKLGYPVFVKPLCLGSSVGVSKADNKTELAKAIEHAFKFGNRIMVEKGVSRAREIVCAVLGSDMDCKTSVCGEVATKNHDFFDYDAKYIDPAGFDFIIPAPLPGAAAARIRDLSSKVFKAVRGYGLARVDFLLDRNTGKIYFCEINTMPGFTSHSLYPRLWEASSVSPEQVIKTLIGLALKRVKTNSALKLSP